MKANAQAKVRPIFTVDPLDQGLPGDLTAERERNAMQGPVFVGATMKTIRVDREAAA
jgi:hypothetical protein